MSQFRMRCTNADLPGSGWWENYDKAEVTTEAEAKAWAEATVKHFNSTLFEDEVERLLLEVEFLGGTTDTPHRWVKINTVSLVTRGGGTHDNVECKACGITARRHGIGSKPTLDWAYRRAKVYRFCNTTKEHLAKRAAK